jgi:hypothetical protein
MNVALFLYLDISVCRYIDICINRVEKKTEEEEEDG